MAEEKYERTIEELEKHACKWWPREVREKAERASVLQYLLDTQEKFISILSLADRNRPESLFALLESASFPLKLFLKHLMVLMDVGAEKLQRVNREFPTLFPDGKLVYDVGGGPVEYSFSALPAKGKLDNKKLKSDTLANLSSQQPSDGVSGLFQDAIMLLSFGAAAVIPRVRAVLYNCATNEYFGNAKKIDRFVRQNYIRVSKIIAGKTANDLGNFAQQYVLDYLKVKLGAGFSLKSNGTIPGLTVNNGATPVTFDIVVDRTGDANRHKPYVGIEISFQETTNSVVERKGELTRPQFERAAANRCFFAHIIDGAGNFERRQATRKMCENSHCNVAFTESEFDVLVNFIREKLA